jgi:hypothetical protein
VNGVCGAGYLDATLPYCGWPAYQSSRRCVCPHHTGLDLSNLIGRCRCIPKQHRPQATQTCPFLLFFSSLDQRPHLVVYLGELKAKQRLGNSDSHLAQDALAYPSRTPLGATSGRTRIYDFSLVWLWAWFRNLRSGENGPGVPTIGGSGHAMPCQLMPCHGVPSRNNVTGT